MTPGGDCHVGHVRCAQCKLRVAISLPASVMASEAKPSPSRVGDCSGRNGRSLAMTLGGACHGGHVRCAQCKLRVAISLPASVMASEAKPSPCRVGDCFGRNRRSLAMTPGGACHGEYVRCAQCKLLVAISLPASVMASEAKPSPCQGGDCFGRKERSLAMTAGWAYRDCCRNQERSSI